MAKRESTSSSADDRRVSPRRLRELRQYFGNLTQGQFGAWFGVEQAMVSQWESEGEKGKRPAPIREIVQAFGVSVDWLMDLSPFMWSYQVTELRNHIRTYLLGPDVEWLHLPEATPTDRFRQLVSECQAAAPGMCTDRFLELLSNTDEATLEAILGERSSVDHTHYSRLANFLDLPLVWFRNGDRSLINDTRLEPYRQVILDAVARGISPEKMALLVEAASA
ncbi:MAG: hypothetical protein JWN15_2578 [Firmicutes bacterium]|nr:hypothetical protein [Bacillota bacterium]